MEPLSDAQFRAVTEGRIPDPEPIADGLWSVAMPMPGELLSYSLAAVQVARSGAVTVVDPGWALDGALERIEGFFASIGRSLGDVATIVVTHAHPDHLGLAGPLRDATGARLVLSTREQASLDASVAPDPVDMETRLRAWGVAADAAAVLGGRLSSGRGMVQPLRADVLVDDGDMLPVEGGRWRALVTPGHTAGHMCIVDEDRRLLFSGDHILPTVFPGLGLGAVFDGNPLDAYLRSLERLRPYDAHQVVPGHGYRFHGLRGRRRDTAEHALRRAREVAAIVSAEPDASIWDVASQLTWSAGWEKLAGSQMLYSALNQTEMYREFVRAGGLSEHAGDR
jgi:glyoxylase-like metal-dependent hydrolase (beta-lactamase superfamily II)